ncbi:uncharacterized protein Z518_04779 [Rhinocladiella mackenziei CBS 650.93]|uniref:HNH domain-containing protein n=1 Tax=Rhinocladiella mackenziei CBS 650.93 TaxID=1442369 RepID=A0A0D2H8L1_9EURO|nr:uncharacterized protein Z518_04779 [Rhinocladiella mackenziei CBS 650.93]KIX06803.1 hypothetical protein Z518_04779 [Rhinocladiella mackenziei CBS 650.93]
MPISNANNTNYDAFRDCLFSVVVEKSTDGVRKGRKRSAVGKKTTPAESTFTATEPSELTDFSDYLAIEMFSSLPEELRGLSHHSVQSDAALSEKWSPPLTVSGLEEVTTLIPGDITDTLTAYGLTNPPKSDLQSFLAPVLSAYIAFVTTPPPKWAETKKNACEICERDWVPMTYHHLIPKQVHAKVLKRRWHEEHQLNSVAWLCRACHSFVHRMASNEELARAWYTVDLICEREDVKKWAQWVQRVRWKKK